MISLAIPFHDTPRTAFFLSRLLHSIHNQNFLDYEIVLIKTNGGMARTHNTAMLRAKGHIIQVLQMDDYLAHGEALQNIVSGFKENREAKWQITACMHDYDGQIANPHVPKWTDDIYTGNNRLGSISTLSFKRENLLLFEEPLQWLVDVDLYYRHYLKHGPPNLLQTPNVVITERPDRLTNTIPNELKANEVEYLRRKYGK